MTADARPLVCAVVCTWSWRVGFSDRVISSVQVSNCRYSGFFAEVSNESMSRNHLLMGRSHRLCFYSGMSSGR